MDDKKLNPLRLIVLLGLVVYFGFLFSQRPQPEPLVVQAPSPTPTAAPAPAPAPAPTNCHGSIEQVVQGQYEIRMTITGAAERILIYTDQGNITASTLEAGSAGEYRIRIPGPATAVQLDDCPPLNLR
ncbi:MAG: hypothetical protein N3C58_04930 [Meiothermus ruber]|jgi:hypothetical protein|nr:hypothetical protein [Meiothermus ruber]